MTIAALLTFSLSNGQSSPTKNTSVANSPSISVSCNDIEEVHDKFNGKITYMSPEADGITFIKVKDGNDTTLYIHVAIVGYSLTVDRQGVILLLQNDNRIEKPTADINVKVNTHGSGYRYIAMEELTEKDVELLSKNEITDDRLYLHDGVIKEGKKLQEYLKCIIAK